MLGKRLPDLKRSPIQPKLNVFCYKLVNRKKESGCKRQNIFFLAEIYFERFIYFNFFKFCSPVLLRRWDKEGPLLDKKL